MNVNLVKKEILEHALSLGLVRILITPSDPGVVVPEQFKVQDRLILNLSRAFGTYMELKEEAIFAELSFAGQSFACMIPWDALRGLQDKRGHVIAFDVQEDDSAKIPEVVLIPPVRKIEAIEDTEEKQITPPRRGHLRLVN